MRILRICVSILALLSVAVTAFFYVSNMGKDVAPVLVCDYEEIHATSHVTDAELLAFVSATDQEDGDLSDEVIVERGSYFLSPGVTKLQFAVSDSDNNVSSITRKLVYTDYTAPKIILKSDLVFPQDYTTSLPKLIKVEDSIDGDISNRLKMISTELATVPGNYKINLKASNRLGDYRDITIDIIITEEDYLNKKILLSDYIIYEKLGAKPDFASYIKGLSSSLKKQYSVEDIKIETTYDPQKSGIYNVFYKIFDDDGEMVTMTRLVVVSEE